MGHAALRRAGFRGGESSLPSEIGSAMGSAHASGREAATAGAAFGIRIWVDLRRGVYRLASGSTLLPLFDPWTRRIRAATRLASNGVALVIVKSLLRTYPFVVAVADTGTNAGRSETLAAIANTMVLLALVGLAIGLSIAVLVHAFQCLKEMWRWIDSRRNPVGSHIL